MILDDNEQFSMNSNLYTIKSEETQPAGRRVLADRYYCGAVGTLDRKLWRSLDDACTESQILEPRQIFSRAGDRLTHSALLLDGMMVRYVSSTTSPSRNRLMVSMQVPGDFVDLHGLPLQYLDHDVSTLTRARIALFPHEALKDIIADNPEDASALWRLTMVDAAIHRHWVYRTGRLRAVESVADFICEMGIRLQACGHISGNRLPLPLMQTDIAEVTGLSTVHVSRVIRELREAGLCTVRDNFAEIHDWEALRRLAGFDPGYLYQSPDG